MASRDIRWRLHLRAPPDVVHDLLATDEGRARWWARSAQRVGDEVLFEFPDGSTWRGRVTRDEPPREFGLDYLGGPVRFTLASDGAGGTDLLLEQRGVPPEEHEANLAGWVSALLALKAAADHGVDLRNHDPRRTWAQGYVDN